MRRAVDVMAFFSHYYIILLAKTYDIEDASVIDNNPIGNYLFTLFEML